jgi:hypothetical protein
MEDREAFSVLALERKIVSSVLKLPDLQNLRETKAKESATQLHRNVRFTDCRDRIEFVHKSLGNCRTGFGRLQPCHPAKPVR